MMIEKIYQNEEDFETEFKRKKPEEVFYSVTPQTVDGGEAGPAIQFGIVFVYAVLDASGRNVVVCIWTKSTAAMRFKSSEEYEKVQKDVDQAVVNKINDLKKLYDGAFFKQGGLRVST